MMMADDTNATWILIRFQHALQALALPAVVQVQLFPDFVCKADELALNFDHWSSCMLAWYRDTLTPAQRDPIDAIDHHLARMSGTHNAALWTDEALHEAPEWNEVRQLARHALAAFGWEETTPPSYEHEYVPGKKPL